MLKNKKDNSNRPQPQKHSRNPSAQRQRDSHPRLTLCFSPPQNRKSKKYLSNPNSLQKKKPKVVKKVAKNKKQQQQQATRQTIQTSGEQYWKDHLKLTFRSKKHPQKEITLRNNSLKCMEQLVPIDSYPSLVNTFPPQDKNAFRLANKQRIYLVDWLNFIASELLLRKNTVHLAIALIDGYLEHKGIVPQKIQALGAGALLLAVKQEQRGCQGNVILFLCSSDSGLTKEQIIKIESSIVLGLSFKLNYNTLPFWFDYFSQKWDTFCVTQLRQQGNKYSLSCSDLALIRSPQGDSYKHYRQAIQLLDALLMHPLHGKNDFPKLTLAVLYLVMRIQAQAKLQNTDCNKMYQIYFQGFSKKASPIFRDRHCFNQIFNEFVVEVCDFEMSEIMGQIRLVGHLLDMGFTYQIDSRIYEQSLNYEQFLRFSTYSQHIRNYFLYSCH